MKRRSIAVLTASVASIMVFIWAMVMRSDGKEEEASKFFQSAGGSILCFLLVYFFFLDTDD